MSVSYLFPSDESLPSACLGPELKPKRDTKSIGDLSEAMVIAVLVRHGYLISIPFGENHRYDLIADDGERLLRIQVKTGRLRRGGAGSSDSNRHFVSG
jgi:hypothetical protein